LPTSKKELDFKDEVGRQEPAAGYLANEFPNLKALTLPYLELPEFLRCAHRPSVQCLHLGLLRGTKDDGACCFHCSGIDALMQLPQWAPNLEALLVPWVARTRAATSNPGFQANGNWV
jgi:hypothetical protein